MQPQRPTPYHIRTMQTPLDPQAGRQMGVWAATAVVTGEAAAGTAPAAFSTAPVKTPETVSASAVRRDRKIV